MDEDYQIKLATKDDLENVVKVGEDAFPPHRVASLETEQDRLKLFPEGFFLLTYKGEIVGKSTGLVINDIRSSAELSKPDKELHNPNGPIYYLGSLGIKKAHQRKGLGSTMIQNHIDHAKKLGKKIFRFTSPDDVEGFYAKTGFKRLTDFEAFKGTSDQAVWEMEL